MTPADIAEAFIRIFNLGLVPRAAAKPSRARVRARSISNECRFPRPKPAPYRPQNKVRFVTATSLFDGHDASVNIMRRIMQASGAEVIHLGQQPLCARDRRRGAAGGRPRDCRHFVQGGHIEFFKYMVDLLRQNGGENIKVFAGRRRDRARGDPGTHRLRSTRIYSPQDGATLGLQGMIDDVMRSATSIYPRWHPLNPMPRRP